MGAGVTLPLFGSLLSNIFGFIKGQQAADRTTRFSKPGTQPGQIRSGERFDTSGWGVDPMTDRSLQELGSNVVGGQLMLQGEQDRIDAIKRQLPYYDRVVSEVEGGTLGKASRKAGELIDAGPQLSTGTQKLNSLVTSGAEAIDQATMDRMVGQIVDRNRAAAGNQKQVLDEMIARTGISPDAAAAIGIQSLANEESNNQAGYRDVAINRQLANTQYAMDLANSAAAAEARDRAIFSDVLKTGGTLGAAYNEGMASALYNRAGLEPLMTPDYASFGAVLNSDALQKLAMMNELDLGQQNALMSLGGGLMNFGLSRLNTKAMQQAQRDAANKGLFGSLFGGGMSAGSMLGAAKILA